MKIKTYTFLITGISPLLQNSAANLNGKTPKGPGGAYIPEEQAKHVAYSFDGKACHPAMGFRKAMLSAAGGKKFKKRTLRAIIASSVFTTNEFSILEDPKSGKAMKSDSYEIDARPGVRNKARVMLWRPRWNHWQAKLELQIDEDIIDPAVVEENLNEGGTVAGVGDYRPEKMGPFGRFTAKMIEN